MATTASDTPRPPRKKRRWWRVLRWVLLLPPLLLGLVVLLVYLPPVQNRLRASLSGFLEQRIGTPVRLEHLSLRFPLGLSLDGLLVLDQQGDTLLSAGEVRTNVGLGALLDGRIILSGTRLAHLVANVHQRPDSTFNFTYILRAFAGDTTEQEPATADTSAPMPFAVSGLALEDVRVHLTLATNELDLYTSIGALDLGMNEMDAAKLRFHATSLAVRDMRVRSRSHNIEPSIDTYPDLPNPFAGLDIDLEEVLVERSGLTMANTVTGDSLWLSLGSVKLVVDSLALERQRIRLASVELDSLRLGIRTSLDTLRRNPHPAPPAWIDRHDGFRYWIRGMDIGITQLGINSGEVRAMRGDTLRPRNAFDPEHLAFTAVKLSAEEVQVNDEHVHLIVRELTARAADSTALGLSCALDATPARIRLDNGMVAVDGAAFRLSGSATPGDPTHAYLEPGNVPLRAELHSTIVLAEMIRLFDKLGIAPPVPVNTLEVWDTHIAFAGTAERVDTFRLDLDGNQGTAIHLQGRAQRSTDPLNSTFAVDLTRLNMGTGLHNVMRAFVPAATPFPQRISGGARLSGTRGALRAKVDLRSDLGDLRGSVGMNGPYARLPEAFDADLTIAHVPLERYIPDADHGSVSMHLNANARAMNGPQRSGAFDLLLSEFRYHGQDLDSSLFTGTLEGDSMHLDARTTASALALVLRTDLRWPVGSDTITGTLGLDVDSLRTHALGLYPHPLSVRGRFDGSGTFSTDGFAHFRVDGDSVVLSNPDRTFAFEEFSLQGHLSNDSTALVLESDALEVDYTTNIPLDGLPTRARERMLAFFRKDSTEQPAIPERMDLRVALPRTEWLAGLLLPDLKSIALEEFNVHYDARANVLDARIGFPILQFQDIIVSGLALSATTAGHALDGTVGLDSARYNDVRLGATMLTATSAPGLLRTALSIARDDGTPRYTVPLEFTRADNTIGLHVAEGLLLDTLRWDADPQNQLRFGDGAPVAQHFRLTHADQTLQLVTGAGHTAVRLERFPMGALLNLVTLRDSTPLVNGELSGEVRLPLAEETAIAADLRIDTLVVNGHHLGDLVVQAESAGQRTSATARFEDGANELDGSFILDASQRPSAMEAHARLGFKDLSFIKPFTGDFLYELSGGVKGSVDWKTPRDGNTVQGDLTFTDAVFGVKRTGGLYRLRNERLLADADGFTFRDLTVLDSSGNAFVLDGRVLTTDLSAMRFDLSLHTGSFQLLNSAPSKDALFHGDLLASMDLRVTGTDKAPVVAGDLGILAGTSLSVVLPGSEVKLIDSDGIVEFTTDLYGTDTSRAATDQERVRDSLRAALPKVDLDLGIRVVDSAAFAIVLDPTTGDQATFQGHGDLRFRYDPDGRMALSGPFIVSKGGYTLEFYGLVKKHFDLLPGSSVTWDGDPIAAKLDIKARYISESAAYPLVANATGTLNEAQRNRLSSRLPFEVVINVAGGMKKPEIGFALDLPREYRNSYPQVNNELDRLADKSRQEERDRQVFGLLVLNSFIQDEASGGAPSSGIATSAARSSVNGILTDQMNKLTGKYVKGVDIQLGVSTIDQAQGSSTYQRTSVDYKVSRSFLDKRLSFEVGGSVGVDEKQGQTGNVSSTRAAQYAILYDLTRDGRFRLRGFYENAFDLYDGDITDSGIALMHTRDLEENEKAREAAREHVRAQRAEESERKRKEREDRTEP